MKLRNYLINSCCFLNCHLVGLLFVNFLVISQTKQIREMNDPNKKIDVNLSSLLSLKAELLRKQAEVSKVKATRSSETFVPSKAKTYKKDAIAETATTNGTDKDAKVYEFEDSALLEKSQKVLEAKSKYYDRMTAMGGQLNSDDNCLVLFNRKKQEDPAPTPARLNLSSSSDDSDSEDGQEYEPAHPDEEWVEYTDCLGRTRKCLRSDLDFIKKKDTELAASIPERLDQTQPNWMLDVSKSSTESRAPESVAGDGMSVMSKHDEMRNNWEKKEVENLSKENVHYQDVFFDEARQHGVGYYAFSTDEEERARQQKELEERRQKTLDEQAQREAQRTYRERIIAERVRAAKNRQRARLGLPPLEEELQEKNTTADGEQPPESKEEKKRKKKEVKLKRKQEKEEKIREEERKNHIRPWDKEKDGLPEKSSKSTEPSDETWTYKPERLPMSQDEWNEQKREERNPEFAPGPEKFTQRDRKRRDNPPEVESMPNEKIPRTSFRSCETAFPMAPPAALFVPMDRVSTFAPFQSTKKAKEFQRKNSSAFANETNGEPVDRRRGAEIPPPVDLDPEPFTRPKPTQQTLENSIEAGLRFLRNNFDKTTMSTKSSWTARSDY